MAAAVDYNVLPNTKITIHEPIYMNPEEENITCCICGEVSFEASKPFISTYKMETPFACCTEQKCVGIVCISCVKDANNRGCKIQNCPFCRKEGGLVTEFVSETLELRDKQEEIMNRHSEAPVSCNKCGNHMPYMYFSAHVDICLFPCPNGCGERITKNDAEHFSTCQQANCNKCHTTYLLGKEIHDPDVCRTLQERHRTIDLIHSELNKYFESHTSELERKFKLHTEMQAVELERVTSLARVCDSRIDSLEIDKARKERYIFEQRKQLQQCERTVSELVELDNTKTREIYEHSNILESHEETIARQGIRIVALEQEKSTMKSDITKLASALDEANLRMRRMEQMIDSLKPKHQAAAAAAAVVDMRGQKVKVEHIDAGYVVIDTPVQKNGDHRVGLVKAITKVPNSGIIYTKIVVEYEKGGKLYDFSAQKQFSLVFA